MLELRWPDHAAREACGEKRNRQNLTNLSDLARHSVWTSFSKPSKLSRSFLDVSLELIILAGVPISSGSFCNEVCLAVNTWENVGEFWLVERLRLMDRRRGSTGQPSRPRSINLKQLRTYTFRRMLLCLCSPHIWTFQTKLPEMSSSGNCESLLLVEIVRQETRRPTNTFEAWTQQDFAATSFIHVPCSGMLWSLQGLPRRLRLVPIASR